VTLGREDVESKAGSVTVIAYAPRLNVGKRSQLSGQAELLGAVSRDVWREYGLKVNDRYKIKSVWVSEKRIASYGVQSNGGKEALFDILGNIKSYRAAALLPVKRAIFARTANKDERKRLFTLLKSGREREDNWLHRQVRTHLRHGVSRCSNQVIVRSDCYRTMVGRNGKAWISVPSLTPGKPIRIPLSTNRIPEGNLRIVIPEHGPVEVHYATAAAKPARPCGTLTLGVDKGYTEALCDSDGYRYGQGLGALLSTESDHRDAKGRTRNCLRAAAKALDASRAQSDRAKAERIRLNNLGTKKAARRKRRFDAQARTVIRTGVHELFDHAAVVAAEDLTKVIKGKPRSRKMNRRLAAWNKGEIANALKEISQRRGSTLQLVNAAYTSQVDPRYGIFGTRKGDLLHCFDGVVFDADHAAAINALGRLFDTEITLGMKYTDVKSVIQERTDSFRSRLPDLDSP
jgi:IS605 OrfB family transposase